MIVTEGIGTGSRNQRPLWELAREARSAYTALLAGQSVGPWWDFVILTANSSRQAERFDDEIQRRQQVGKLPPGARFLTVPDISDKRMGSGGATLNALRRLAKEVLPAALDGVWWSRHRVLLVHCGGDSDRLPQYSFAGKFFTTLPLASTRGEFSTVFDEAMVLSTSWAAGFPPGLLIASGDVLLTFDATTLNWSQPGVTGVAMRQPLSLASRHGVYITGSGNRVYEFFQKPAPAQVQAAGGVLADQTVALDVGLMRFDAATCLRLADVALCLDSAAAPLPFIDLYQQVTHALTGRWKAAAEDHPVLRRLSGALDGVPFWCCMVEGDFTHIGSTRSFQRLLIENSALAHLDPKIELIDLALSAVPGNGLVVDSVLSAPEMDRESIVIECDLEVPVHAARGAILHGLSGAADGVDVPENTVVHQVPLLLPNGSHTWVIRVYGVEDDPKVQASDPVATWLGRPILETLASYNLDPELVWADVPGTQRCLWNAALFPTGPLDLVWRAARWMMGATGCFSAAEWCVAERVSLEASGQHVDAQALSETRSRRRLSAWQLTALSLARSGADIRPMLAHSPGVPSLAAAGRSILAESSTCAIESPTEAASLSFQASLFLAKAGMVQEAERAQAQAFANVQQAVANASYQDLFRSASLEFRHEIVNVAAPPRIDLGGGWSDTPPFCIDWGGTVLNIAVELEGRYPIVTTVRRLGAPLFRFISGDARVEFTSAGELPGTLAPGSPFAIHLQTLRMTGLTHLLTCGVGGLEIDTEVNLPMGSGLGTSSILAATMLRALAEMFGWTLSDFDLLDQVSRLEQLMSTGGGWQDQAGGIFQGAKLLVSGPGIQQRVRVEPLSWTPERQAEFEGRLVLYYTGIQRIAKGLLRQVVGRYLAREVAAVQVLHSIKTLALEMAYALREGEWDHLGALLDRHWMLNQVLDPNTTNAPINALLRQVRPLIAGAKLAGAGGGGFMLLLARDPDAAARVRRVLSTSDMGLSGAVYRFDVTNTGLRIRTGAATGLTSPHTR